MLKLKSTEFLKKYILIDDRYIIFKNNNYIMDTKPHLNDLPHKQLKYNEYEEYDDLSVGIEIFDNENKLYIDFKRIDKCLDLMFRNNDEIFDEPIPNELKDKINDLIEWGLIPNQNYLYATTYTLVFAECDIDRKCIICYNIDLSRIAWDYITIEDIINCFTYESEGKYPKTIDGKETKLIYSENFHRYYDKFDPLLKDNLFLKVDIDERVIYVDFCIEDHEKRNRFKNFY